MYIMHCIIIYKSLKQLAFGAVHFVQMIDEMHAVDVKN